MINQRSGVRYALILVGLIVLATLIMDFNGRMAQLRRLTAEEAVVSERLAGANARMAALELEITQAASDAAVREWAYNSHMVMPGDQPAIPLQPAGAVTEPTPTPAPTPTAVSNWQAWMSLFTGPEQP
jgi:hypothetical protein